MVKEHLERVRSAATCLTKAKGMLSSMYGDVYSDVYNLHLDEPGLEDSTRGFLKKEAEKSIRCSIFQIKCILDSIDMSLEDDREVDSLEVSLQISCCALGDVMSLDLDMFCKFNEYLKDEAIMSIENAYIRLGYMAERLNYLEYSVDETCDNKE